MAVTKLLRLKETKGSNPAAHLKKNIFYICDPAKTEGGLYIGGNAGVSPEMIYAAFIQNKQNWGKETNALKNCTQGFHYMLSFPPDSGISESLAYEITQEFCKQLLSDRHYYVFAVHNDKAHMHTHITFDSVSKEDGYMFHSPKKDWEKRIQPITDSLCEKYHLPTLQYDQSGDRRGKNYGAWDHERQTAQEPGKQKTEKGTMRSADNDAMAGRIPESEVSRPASGKKTYDWFDIIRDDIDEAIGRSGSYEEFLSELRRQKYSVRDKKYLSLKPYGRGNAVRTGRLGSGYGKEEIRKRIADKTMMPQIEKRLKTYGDREEMRDIIYAKTVRTPGFKMTPFQKEFFRRWNNTFYIRKPDRVQTWKYKKNIIEVQRLADSIRYLIDYNIRTQEELQNRQESLITEQEALERKYQSLCTRLRRAKPYFSIRQFERIQKQYENDPDALLFEKMQQIRTEIEKDCPFEEAKKQYGALKEEIRIYRKMLYDVKQERKLAAQVQQTFYDTQPDEQQPDEQEILDKIQAEQNRSQKQEYEEQKRMETKRR